MPVPSADQAVPSQRARLRAKLPPATTNEPPATRLPSGSTASALTSALTPLPSGDQAVPSQRAMLAAATPWTDAKPPPMTRESSGNRTSLVTVPCTVPNRIHAVPFQRCSTSTNGGTVLCRAAATTSPLPSAATAVTSPSPEPYGSQAEPVQRAMLAAGTPAICENDPPTTTSPFGNGAIAVTGPSVPCDARLQPEPSQCAKLRQRAPARTSKLPPANSPVLVARSAVTRVTPGGPSAIQF